jgi:hypothetical protein
LEEAVADIICVERWRRKGYVGHIQRQGERSRTVGVLKGGSAEAAAWVLRMKRDWSSVVAPDAWDVYATPNVARRLRDAAVAEWQANNPGRKPDPEAANRLRMLAVKQETSGKFEGKED